MSFRDYLRSGETYKSTPRPSEPVEMEEKVPEPTYRDDVREEDQYEDDMNNEVEFYKKELYKKIDRCFVRYGLEGLKIINQGIAGSLKQYINGLKGGSPSQRRYDDEPGFRSRRSYEDDQDYEPEEEEEDRRPPERPIRRVAESIRRPIRRIPDREEEEENTEIEQTPARSSSPARPVRENTVPTPKKDQSPFDVDLINKMLEEVPPTEIHEVEVNSSIPRPWDKKADSSEEYVDQEATETAVEEPLEEQPDETTEEVEEQPQTGSYDIANDMLAGVSGDSVDLIVPPAIEEPTGDDGSDLDAPIEEPTTTTPIQIESKSRKKKK